MPPHLEILIVDDEPDIRFMLRMTVGKQPDIEMVREAGDGMEAVSMVRERCPDVVLLDIGMPIMDGIEATPRIRAACSHTKIVILTAYINEDLLQSALDVGADLCLSKVMHQRRSWNGSLASGPPREHRPARPHSPQRSARHFSIGCPTSDMNSDGLRSKLSLQPVEQK
ncbi:MAG: response regulator transcription factor [Actinomycetota bacterium]